MSREVQLTQNKIALIDDEDWVLISGYRWHFSRTTGYARSWRYVPERKNNTAIYMHRLIMGLYDTGPHELNEVDHISHNKLDNRKGNLRLCTRIQNCDNSRRHPGKTGYRGVWWDPKNKRYCVVITSDKRRVFLGRYDTLEEAVFVWNREALKVKGEFAMLNTLPEGAEEQHDINIPTLSRNNTSSFRGVRFDKRAGKWVAKIGHNYKTIPLGAFPTAPEAAKAYDIAAEEIYGSKARLNFPRKDTILS